jgi:hypothetical protein
MSERVNKVILIVDRNYSADLATLASDCHVWLIESAGNSESAASYWTTYPESNRGSGLTTFAAADDESGPEACLKILKTIDLHHGACSSDPPYSVLEIVGAPLSRSVKTAIEALGFSRFESTDNGFRALR